MNRHTWYLTEELIPLSLFDENLPVEERKLLAEKIGEQTSGGKEMCKPTLPTLNSKSLTTDFVGDFIGPFKHKVWHQQQEYNTVKNSLKNFSPLNDSCERTLGLATCINTHITRDKDSSQEFIQVVEARRKNFQERPAEVILDLLYYCVNVVWNIIILLCVNVVWNIVIHFTFKHNYLSSQFDDAPNCDGRI